MASCRASMATTSSDHDVLITAGRRMVEGRPCAEGGSRDPVVRARHPCPPMPEPMPSASELPHHSMMRMVRRTTAMPRPVALACYAVLRYSRTSPVLPGTAQQPARAQQRSPVICSRKGLCLSVPCALCPADALRLASRRRDILAARKGRRGRSGEKGCGGRTRRNQEGRQERKELSWAGVTMASLADAGCLAAGAGTGTGAGTGC